jgi:hypothetical protein
VTDAVRFTGGITWNFPAPRLPNDGAEDFAGNYCLHVELTHPCSVHVPHDSVTLLLSAWRARKTRTAALLDDSFFCSANAFTGVPATSMASSASAYSGLRVAANDRFVSWRLLGASNDLGECILQDVLGERAVSDAALQVTQKRSVILEQRRNRCRAVGSSVHHLIVLSQSRVRHFHRPLAKSRHLMSGEVPQRK